MNSPHHHHHHHPRHEHHDVHQQRLLWFFSFCNQRSSSSSNSSGSTAASTHGRRGLRRKSASNRNKFAIQYQQQLQQQQRQVSHVFGLDLTEHVNRFAENDSIPFIVKSCTRFIEKHGIIFGIYRLSGTRVNIHKLRQDFDKNPKISMIDSEHISNDAHAVACVLKQYFRELPTPLLTFHMYEKFIELFKQSNSLYNSNQIDVHDIEPDDRTSLNATPADVNDNHDGDNQNQNKTIIIEKPSSNTLTATKSFGTIQTNTAEPTTSITQQPLRLSSEYQQKTPIESTAQKRLQSTSSVSDSQLISLSSVVTTTTNDVKYQVKLDDLRKLLSQLPRAHYQTLKFLMRHLACIAANGQKTGMDSKNVAIVWAPNLLKPRELELTAGLETLQIIGLQAVITEQLIRHHKFLFDDDVKHEICDSIDEEVV